MLVALVCCGDVLCRRWGGVELLTHQVRCASCSWEASFHSSWHTLWRHAAKI